MNDILRTINTRQTPQNEQATPGQVKNSAGGFVFEVNSAARLRRFLVLGTEGGTFYVSAKELTKDNAAFLLGLARTDEGGAAIVREVLELDRGNRAPKHNTLLFALAAVAGTSPGVETRRAALDAVNEVARTGTHIFTFVGYVEQFRGWGRGLRSGVARWYESRSVDDLAYQAVKYRQREGWSHRDLLRLAHPLDGGANKPKAALYDWICGRSVPTPDLPELIQTYERVADPGTDLTVDSTYSLSPVEGVERGLAWEMLPNEALSDPAVWRALVAKRMPMTALIRQLPRMTRLGVLTGETLRQVVAQITDQAALRKSRIHPVNVLIAQRTYASGRSVRGESTWQPVRAVVDALDEAFYKSFGNVEPTGKRHLLALDVSGSMMSQISGLPISAREASAALALVTMSVEQEVEVVGFHAGPGNRWKSTTSRNHYGYGHETGITPLTLSPRQRLDDATASINRLPFGATDCALPMLYAIDNQLDIDTFVIYTDSETWFGSVHPHQALQRYRQKSGIDAKLVVVGMTSTGFSIADPSDPGSLDIAGFDSAVPQLISDFSRGL